MAFQRIAADLFQWADLCNVYVVKDGDAALLIDLGDGTVLEHLKDIGVQRVEWVLFTHHHREQCMGAEKLDRSITKVAAPAEERALFERPGEYRKMFPSLGDAHAVYGASYARPPQFPIAIDRAFSKMDDFTWRGREFWCIDTRGNSPGSMSYLLKRNEGWLAFTGDLMLEGATLHNWFDSEWDYGFAKGIYALFNSAHLVESFDPALLLPSHGPTISRPAKQLALFQDKLRTLAKHYIRGYELFTFAGAAQDRVSAPTTVPHVWRISKHLYKFKGPDFWPNFTILIADSGKALVIDCGLFNVDFLDRAIAGMKDRLGLRQIEAVFITHMHGDHCQEAPHLREKWGAKLWTMDRVAPIVQHPHRYDYAAPINTYGKPFQSISFDRILADGETFEWEGYTFTVDWMPGQTEFACCIHGEVDGKTVAFTGDNIFASTTDPAQTGHEAVVARNSCILEESYLYAAHFLHSIGPDLLLGGHSWVMDQPRDLIERYRIGAQSLRDAFRALSGEADYRLMYDPYWVRAYPYRATIKPGESVEVVLIIRNFRDKPQSHRVALLPPEGIEVEPRLIEGKLAEESYGFTKVRVTARPQAKEGVRSLVFDATLDGRRYGPLFDMIVNVSQKPATVPTEVPAKTGEKPEY
jgi:glyoxylase-like metal-dependent hydrolase (beta-lactamase superfamily II)